MVSYCSPKPRKRAAGSQAKRSARPRGVSEFALAWMETVTSPSVGVKRQVAVAVSAQRKDGALSIDVRIAQLAWARLLDHSGVVIEETPEHRYQGSELLNGQGSGSTGEQRAAGDHEIEGAVGAGAHRAAGERQLRRSDAVRTAD